jgi:predicted 3-demethylubiquinone-9 3-methyltransferase (glyoxalase superfamily)
MKKLIPFLWFDGQAEEAARHYTSIFKDSKMGSVSRYGDAGPGKPGTALTASFEIMGLEFVGLNGGPQFKFTEAVSFQIPCESQEEVDYYWTKLGEGGTFSQCGWLKDKFGLSWQVVPTALPKLLSDPDKAKANRVMQAMLKMQKLDIAKLEAAGQG